MIKKCSKGRNVFKVGFWNTLSGKGKFKGMGNATFSKSLIAHGNGVYKGEINKKFNEIIKEERKKRDRRRTQSDI